MNHLTDIQLQSLADGTLRGPEGMAAREHCDGCVECATTVTLYSALDARLSALRDPEPPADFTGTVLAAVQLREAHLAARRHTLIAAIPAFALAIFAIVGWGLSTAVHVDKLIEGVTVLRMVWGVVGPVFVATRIPLGIGAFVFLAAVLTLLSRTLKPAYARLSES
jgi:anti-sigma factor RsiW